MAGSYVGPAPWSSRYKRTAQKTREHENIAWSLSSGYRYTGLDFYPEGNFTKPKMRPLKLYNGKIVMVPEDDYADFIGYQKMDEARVTDDIQEYVSTAKFTQEVEGCGHIAKIQYSPRRWLMMVTFAAKNGGAVVVYFMVPKEVYSELRLYALSKQTIIQGNDERHVLGMRFWDIVRIRGTKHGGRYEFKYEQGNESVAGEESKSGDDAAEAQSAKDAGFTTVTLGPRILRSETAPIAALSAIMFHFEEI